MGIKLCLNGSKFFNISEPGGSFTHNVCSDIWVGVWSNKPEAVTKKNQELVSYYVMSSAWLCKG